MVWAIGAFVLLALALGTLCFACVTRMRPALRVAVCMAFPACLLALVAADLQFTGIPKPYMLETRETSQSRIVSFTWVEGQVIWLWLWLPNAPTPVAFELPWSQELAQKLQDGANHARELGTKLMIGPPVWRLLEDLDNAIEVADPPPPIAKPNQEFAPNGDGQPPPIQEAPEAGRGE